MNDSICYLDGRFVRLRDAKVSVLDRGFIFGDGVYEVIPVFGGIPFRLPEHLRRLSASLAAAMIDNPLSNEAWTSICTRVVGDNRGADQSLYVQVTRGVAPRNHVLTERVTPTVFVMCSELVIPEQPEPITAVTMDDLRWARCDIKSTSLIANVIAREYAARRGAGEAIFVRNGIVTEGAASNVFVAHGDVIRTPPLSHDILPGITRDLLCELLAEGPTVIRQSPVSEAELRSADEIWVTSSSRELVPVVALDDEPVGDGRVGPGFDAVRAAYRAYKARIQSRA